MNIKNKKTNIEKKKEKTVNFAYSILEKIKSENDLLVAIFLAEWLATFLWRNYCGIYRMDELEDIIFKKIEFKDLKERGGKKKELHIASEIFTAGGHTPLLRILVTESKNCPDVLLTRSCDRNKSLSILKINDSRLHVVGGKTYLDKIYEIAEIINGYENVVLHIHPDDIICSIALHLVKRTNVNLHIALQNHADHSFSVGLGIADSVLEISTYGWNLRYQKGLIEKSSFVGIPIDKVGKVNNSVRSKDLILTGGSSYKFKPIGDHSLPRVLHLLFKSHPELKLLALGPGRLDFWWWPLIFRYGKRVKIKKLVSRADYLVSLDACRIYVDSYPVTGGTAFPEALMLGCDIVGLKGTTWGSNFADNLRSTNPSNFIDMCSALIAEKKETLALQQDIRQKCLEFHSPKAVLDRIELTRSQKILHQPPDGFIKESPPISFEIAWGGFDAPFLPSFYCLEQFKAYKLIVRSFIKYFGLLKLPLVWFVMLTAAKGIKKINQ